MMYKKILLPLDLNHKSSWQRALPEAMRIAASSEAELHLLTVVPDFGMAVVGSHFPDDFEQKALASADKLLRDLAAEQIGSDVNVTTHVSHGRVYDKIVETAGSIGADLIVMAAHDRDLKEYLVGSNAERVMRHSDCSFLLVRGD